MERHVQPADWIEVVGWFSLAVAFASALVILVDIVLGGHRQKMWIMNLVYPVTALYWGPVALWFYFTRGRRTSKPVVEKEGMPDSDKLPRWDVQSKAISHCGAGCTLGDIGAEWLVYAASLTLAGTAFTPTSLWISPSPGSWASSSSTSPSYRCATSAGSRASGRP